MASDLQFGIRYEGAPLACTTRYFWRAKVWDEAGQASEWSGIASFVTGFFGMEDWTARWFDATWDALLARREFRIDGPESISEAFLFVAAIGGYANSVQVRLNGHVLGDNVLFPGPTEFFRARYLGFDVTSRLVPGPNTLGLVLTRRTSAILVVRSRDGSVTRLETDDSWQTLPKGPFVELPGLGTFMAGRYETFDARGNPSGWDLPGFAADAWKPHEWKGWWTAPIRLAYARCGVRIARTFRPVGLSRKDDGRLVADFGQNLSGFVRMRCRGPRGTAVTIRYAETLDGQGEIDPASLASDNPPYATRYILAGDGPEVYQPTFFYTGFRYVEISGFPGEPGESDFEACFLHSDVETGSRFECGDPDVNRLADCAAMSFLSNLVNIPTDCPGRERRGWTADAFTVSEAECIRFDMLNLYRRWFDDCRDVQRKSGWIPVEFPLDTVRAIDVIWPCACVLVPWDVYQAYGDIR